ncbi:MAG TPA: urease accessory protein UreE [Leptolyngbyaceae cyanobacterium M33_DOE_097]|uniref:Urease accessory protein UreE n=1 Tax=Oscillatoriales cyanobacterium SpSt-418 TaxID=2282169 RepID=A0A7C3PD91_9CYAN|nr:urease accessory protein UreE [Leptolyngbyaceae cyanobacterium M33_DOE_097]
MPIILSQRSPDPHVTADLELALTAEERGRSRHRFETLNGEVIFLQLPRGTTLKDGDVLQSADGTRVKIVAKPEPILIVEAANDLALLKAAYHLGNRHVPLEILVNRLHLSPDPVLREMLEHRGLQVTAAIAPFQPESGAYEHHHD